MKEIEYRYTNHDWYLIARAFMVVIVAFALVSVFSFVTEFMDPAWLHFTIGGTIVKSIGVVISLGGGFYLGFNWTGRIFDKQGKLILDNEKVTILKNKKEYQFYLHDIDRIETRIFASYNDKRAKDRKLFGPMYIEYMLTTDRGVFCECCSVAEGWEKIGGDKFNKNGVKPHYTVDDAYGELERVLKERENKAAEIFKAEQDSREGEESGKDIPVQ